MRVKIVKDLAFLLVSIVCAIFQTVGVTTVHWWVVQNILVNGSSTETSFGIWQTNECIDHHCTTENRQLSGELAWLLGVAVIESVSAALCILSVGVATGFVIRTIQERDTITMKKLYIVLLGGAGAVIILGVLLFVKKKAGLTPLQSLQTKDGNPAWSLALSSAAGGISILAAVAMAMYTFCNSDEDDEEDEKMTEYWQNKLKELDNITTVTVTDKQKVSEKL
ncbi:hypothetical protein FSP39_010042 [Pinctada imbricata]|uniref:Uncharacterized protein n=1 Tax=Pinctada imbricata TaxID=66713 RepID=A0AA88YC47_PINIB|nr:hypothetical protein FSP39_010042 [Pinctada imbricata]